MNELPFLKENGEKEQLPAGSEHNAEESHRVENGDGGIEQEEPSSQQSGEATNELALEAAYFNDIKVVDGRKVIQNPANVLALVNKEFALPGTYKPADLTRPKVAFSFGEEKVEKSLMRKEAAAALERMFAEAKKDGVILYAASGYRSYQRQKEVLQAEISRVGKEKAVQAVAIPGNSEHQSGLAMDITSQSEKFLLTEHFGLVKEGIWLRENAHKFGFILRYPKDKEDVTLYEYEPWHFRYVGEKVAAVIYKHKWTLEEYLEQAEKI